LSLFNEDYRTQWFLLPFYYWWLDKYGGLASDEAFRRYLSFLQFTSLPIGTPNVLSRGIHQPDIRFLNPFNNLTRYDNTPLVQTIRRGYWNDIDNPIITEEEQPRLLLVAVDVQDSTTVTFDSYPKKNNQRMSVYGDGGYDGDDSVTIQIGGSDTKDYTHGHQHAIVYNDGIRMKHLLTTFSSHIRHSFPEVDVKPVIVSEDYEIKKEGEEKPRPFMDGFYLNNTPLREVLQAHRDYYHKIKGENVPQLEICIGDLYTTRERGTPQDPDAINNRVQNVLYHDKSKYDEKVTAMISDYINIIDDLMNMLKDKGMDDSAIYKILNDDLQKRVLSKHRSGGKRDIEHLIKGRVTINKIQRIEYGEGQKLGDSDNIWGKAFEFSKHTIRDLMKKGYEDASKKLGF
jgi:NTE family protein